MNKTLVCIGSSILALSLGLYIGILLGIDERTISIGALWTLVAAWWGMPVGVASICVGVKIWKYDFQPSGWLNV